MNLEIFKNENFEVRVAVDENNEPLFCLSDVCKILELTNASVVKSAIISEFDDDLSLTYPIFDSLGREQNATFITEPQLYFVLMRSDKPNAKPFRMFVNKEVLPSIRKTGSYTQNFIPQDLPTALRAYANEVEQKELALKQRDQALATKAWIGSKREATAMATASAAKREAQKLQIQLDQNEDWATVKKVEFALGGSYDWRKLTATSAELKIERIDVPDKNYGTVKSYHKDVWLKAYGIDITNLDFKKGA
jgi:gp36